ncbi:hypothetical protein B0I35DRAFT_405130 [Stachybotrys elegans]|uniref:Uncharacterized protein n=1 Tax=Stachybotrys elegans TaxID=80388 RepID=A0A8K0SZN6_9HYPO|nr:hypothetical protein B0I35DRAFT_405130 [Stachybotrys elegans]
MIAKKDTLVYVLMHQDSGVGATVLGVFADMSDANERCLRQATDLGVPLVRESPTEGPDHQHNRPMEPMRWDTAEGVSCWVEEHRVEPCRVIKPPKLSAPAPERKNSRLYDDTEDPDDVGTDKDEEGHYD